MSATSTFDLGRCLEVLERTPRVLDQLLEGLSAPWTEGTEGPDTWSPYDVVGHLLHGERTDWKARIEIILGETGDRRFVPFDRFAQLRERGRVPLDELLREFRTLRAANVAYVRALDLGEAQLDRTGIHPDFGQVTLRQLIATWTAHDLDHIVQIARVMARQVGDEVGPWVAYLRVVRERV